MCVLGLIRRWGIVAVGIWVMTQPLMAAQIEIQMAAGGSAVFDAEIVQTPEDTARGLMFREQLDRDAAMVFVFDPPQPVRFWMRNTLIPLDMLFVDAAHQIQKIETRHDTQSDRLTSVPTPMGWVIEINAGEADRRGIKTGDYMRLIMD